MKFNVADKLNETGDDKIIHTEPHPTSVKATTVTVVLSSIAAIIFSASLVICTVSIWKVSKMKRIVSIIL